MGDLPEELPPCDGTGRGPLKWIARLTVKTNCIRFCRMLGTTVGLGGSSTVLWYWWPEAHGYLINPFGIFMLGTAVLTDLIYPYFLWSVRQTEVILPSGRIVSREQAMHMSVTGKKEY